MTDSKQHSMADDFSILRNYAFDGIGNAALDRIEEQLEALQPAPFEYRKVFESSEEMVEWLGRLAASNPASEPKP